MAEADPDRLQQVVWNLLSNAVKFTPAGGHVEVGLARQSNTVEIRVADTGRGIDPGFLPHMFDRFKQGESNITRSHGGLGLGLAIARQLVELHGGTITAQSAGIDKGATFLVRLPLPKLRKPRFKQPTAGAGPDLTNHPLQGANILLIEDNPASAEAMKVLLTRLGASVNIAHSARDGIDLFQKHRPGVVISDIAMPDMDGYAFIRRIREMETQSKAEATPAVALSAFTREDDRSKAIEAGFDEHVSKPLDTQKLISTLVALLRN